MSLSFNNERGEDTSALPPAGVPPARVYVTAKDCVTLPNERSVPKTQERFWHGNERAGEKVLHPGFIGHEMPPDYHTYGVSGGPKTDTAGSLINPPMKTNVADVIEQAKEARYKGLNAVPIGHQTTRGHLPDKAKSRDFVFGASTKSSIPAKEVIHPIDGDKDEPDVVKRQYVKAFQDYGAGEQVTRDYKGPDGTGNMKDRVYGRPTGTSALLSGVQTRNLVHPHETAAGQNEKDSTCPDTTTKLASIHVAQHKKYHDAELGKVRHNTAAHNLPEGHTFGYKKPSDGDTSQSLLPHPCMPADGHLPDPDLGRSIPMRGGRTRKFTARELDETAEWTGRVAGIPSIRTDIPMVKNKSITDQQNYGDEPGSKTMLVPLPWVEIGVSENDWNAPISKEDLHSYVFLPDNPFDLTEDEFDFLCGLTKQHSLGAVHIEEDEARVNHRAYSTTDKSARHVQNVKNAEGGYLSIEGFIQFYKLYEHQRVTEQIRREDEQRTQEGLREMTIRQRSANMETTRRLNEHAKKAIERKAYLNASPLAFGSS
ncbi:putative EF-hand domain-containing family member B [Blattamonas nauphoetae]|uniref:EF-hand domain-containing family member B n=1 Tax=Blattamonas nauphoetae TaxID=2049346 RepID=A0ABQ9XR30_9EUKA|nr:putative EF-hand domain-containing family member B [Blattamonas nauphoetae]